MPPGLRDRAARWHRIPSQGPWFESGWLPLLASIAMIAIMINPRKPYVVRFIISVYRSKCKGSSDSIKNPDKRMFFIVYAFVVMTFADKT